MGRRLALCSVLLPALALAARLARGGDEVPAKPAAPAVAHEPFPGEERHLANIRQLTFGGENAEAYWSFAGDRVVFQTTRPPYTADQIFTMRPDGSELTLVSTGKGRTTCAFFLPGDQRILFASTHLGGDEPPPPPDRSHGYVWGIFDYELFTADLDGKHLTRLTDSPGYDAEATVSPKGDRIVFTSSRDGDLDIYTMAIDGSDVKRLTTAVGYDGGPVFSPDGTKIAFRAQHPEDDAGKAEFKGLLAKGMVRPSKLDLWVMDLDGANKKQVTTLGKASFGPFFSHDGKKLLFSSNLDDPTGRSFDLYLVGLDGGTPERVTFFTTDKHDDFDGFPMFSPDGTRLLWCSNRHNARPHETNVFVADWKD
jgi:Tol biopolymer transport system component